MEKANSYLENLAVHMVAGLARLPDEFRGRHIGFLTARQNADGGFSGREGGSDLYYTGFALRGLAGFIPPVFAYAEGTPFASLNRLFYSPLCLAIAAGLAVMGTRGS